MKKTSPPYRIDAEGNYRFRGTVAESQIIDLAANILEQRICQGDFLSSPADTKRYVTAKLGHLEREVFACLFLNNRHQLIACEVLFYGTIDGTSVHPREVVKRAFAHNAAALVAAHNHPSGIAEPSQADCHLTRRLKEALSLLDIRFLDHIVVGGTETVSFAERGLL
jgi:DNA repair protein RadC